MNSPSTPDDWPTNALPKKLIEWLFEKMLLKWGKQFADKWAVADAEKLKKEWAKELFGLSEIEFRRGVAKLNSLERPPSQPEFLKACRPEVNPLTAYYEAVEGCRSREQGEVGTWSHPAIFWASVRVSAYELKTQTYSQIRQRWEAALAAELAKSHWDEIPAPMVALPAPGKDKLSREEATKMMETLKAKTVVNTNRGDGKDWARKILNRKKDGDNTLLPIQVQFAQMALRNYEGNDSD